MVLTETPDFGLPLESEPPRAAEGNPKRRQQAAKISRMPAYSAKVQQVLQASREANKKATQSAAAQDRKQREDMLYALRVQKRKQKHRGR